MDKDFGYEKERVKKQSTLPYYAAGAVWLLYGLIFSLYRLSDLIIAAVISGGVFALVRMAVKPFEILVDKKPEKVDTGNKEADEVIAAGRETVRTIRAVRVKIDNAVTAEKVRRIEDLAERILTYVAEHTDKVGAIRRFLNYYLPTVRKIVTSYESLEEQGVRGENITESMTKTEGILDTIISAFEKQLDSLFADETLDITSDITVLESMMKSDGIKG
jgi:5-bromo-4-chloroindolyl phosphate hydrolysis protein